MLRRFLLASLGALALAALATRAFDARTSDADVIQFAQLTYAHGLYIATTTTGVAWVANDQGGPCESIAYSYCGRSDTQVPLLWIWV